MKKTICFIIACHMILVLAGCGADNPPNTDIAWENSTPTVGSETENTPEPKSSVEIIPPTAEIETEVTPEPESSGDNTTSADVAADEKTNIDVDLTLLSSTMVYAEVSNMMITPENYIGKTVKMHGQFTYFQAVDESGQPIPGQIYFACIIADATACCAQGLEFVLTGEHTYPDDYPELGADITVIGTFDTYEENGYLYCQLIHAELVD